MTTKQRRRAGVQPPARSTEEASEEDTRVMPAYGFRSQIPGEGVTVTGEALRRIAPEGAEFLIEVVTSAPTAAQAMNDNQARTAQVAQALTPLGIQPADLQTISLNVHTLYAPVIPALQQHGGLQQLMPGTFAGVTADVQSAMYHARNVLRVNLRDTRRLGEAVDTAARADASVLGGLSLRAGDESGARRAALDAAAKDARNKAETLAAATGKQIGEPVVINEDVVVSNGAYTALRSIMPFAFGPGAPPIAGELEYYARVSATFRFQ
jgi:uncharacterized protein YggE